MLVIDVDAVSKLAHWNILPIVPDLTGYQWGQISTVSSLAHRARRCLVEPDGKLFHSAGAAQLAVAAIGQMVGLPPISPGFLETLSASPQIDSGEALLLSAIAELQSGCFLTGDKRALRALAKTSVASNFAGKIIPIEYLVWGCLELKGRDWVLENICPFRGIDKAIGIALGSRCDATSAAITDGLASYVKEIDVLYDPSLLSRRICCIQPPNQEANLLAPHDG